MYEIFEKIWSTTQIVFAYCLAGLLVLAIVYFFYRLDQEVRKDKEKQK